MFEYKALKGNDLPSPEQLNSFAEEGWEVVQIIRFSSTTTDYCAGDVLIYFKRVKMSS